MATVKSLTSRPGLEGSLLRCQGHNGRSNRQRLRVLSVFLFLKPKCLHMLALPLSFLTTINSYSSRAAIFVRDRESSAPWVGSGIPVHLDPYRYTVPRQPVSVHSVLPPRTASSNHDIPKTCSDVFVNPVTWWLKVTECQTNRPFNFFFLSVFWKPAFRTFLVHTSDKGIFIYIFYDDLPNCAQMSLSVEWLCGSRSQDIRLTDLSVSCLFLSFVVVFFLLFVCWGFWFLCLFDKRDIICSLKTVGRYLDIHVCISVYTLTRLSNSFARPSVWGSTHVSIDLCCYHRQMWKQQDSLCICHFFGLEKQH